MSDMKNCTWDLPLPSKPSAYRRLCIICKNIFTASPAETYDENGNYIEYICNDCKRKEGL